MGLDMYLHKHTYVKNWEHHSDEQRVNITVMQNGKEHPTIKTNRISTIIEEVAYWRKANQIHNWFVQNVQDGDDNCQEHYVGSDQLKELVETCKKVLASLENSPKKTIQVETGWHSDEQTDVEVAENTELAEELLPTQSGFFFGSTKYDEYYINDLKDTIQQLEPLLTEEGGSFYYSSSW